MFIKNKKIICMLIAIFVGGLYQSADSQETKSENILNGLSKKYTVSKLKINNDGIITYIEGDLTPANAQGDETEISYTFFEENKHLFWMNSPRQELIEVNKKKDSLGMTHVFFKQTYKNIEVYGGEEIVHFTSNKRIKSVNGFYKHDIKISTTPDISQQTSESIAFLDLEKNFGKGNITDTRLMVYDHEGSYHLIWKVILKVESPPGNWEYFIDAHSGAILFKANRINY